LDKAQIIAAFAQAAIAGGARGVRIEGAANVREVRNAISEPIVGLTKRDLSDSDVRITPFLKDIDDLADAGADIIAFDATLRSRPMASKLLCGAVRRAGRLAMADVSDFEEGRQAFADGADIVATTMSGYTGGAVPALPDFALLSRLVALGRPIIAEGRISSPEQAAKAIGLGAFAVVVGTAITRTEIVTEGYARAVERARDPSHSAPVGAR
jgi:putative N-acetylmannosamine-6-phosphate epimerase